MKANQNILGEQRIQNESGVLEVSDDFKETPRKIFRKRLLNI